MSNGGSQNNFGCTNIQESSWYSDFGSLTISYQNGND